MHAAVKMFNQKGFHATSLDEVAQTLKISKPTIYHYLGNKEQILMTCLEAGVAHLLQAAKQVQQQHEAGAAQIRAFLYLYGLRILDDFGRCVILTPIDVLSLQAQQQLQQQKRQVHQAFVEMIAQAMQDSTIQSQHHAKLLAVTLTGAMNSAAKWYRVDGELSADEAVTQMVDILMQGLLPR